MEDLHKNILREKSVYLMENVSMGSLFLHRLHSTRVITSQEQERIEAATTMTEQVGKLLTILRRKDKNAFKKFCGELRSDGQDHVAEVLEQAEKDAKEQKRSSLSGGNELSSPGPSQKIPTSTQGRKRKASEEEHEPAKVKLCAASTSGAAESGGTGGNPPCSVRTESDISREEKYKAMLSQHRPQLVRELNTEDGLYDYLIRDKVVDGRTKRRLTHGVPREEKTENLLEYLANRPLEDLEAFIRALHTTRQGHLANLFN